MMQPESQALVREFTRRLKAALRGAPNHVRLEAALEVESHVNDVLSRHGSDLPELEQVAEILSHFGTPEEYARALSAQVPAVEVVTMRSGAREVGIALTDLVGGVWRLGMATIRQIFAVIALIARLLWRGATTTLTWGRERLEAARGPAGEAASWGAARVRGGLRLGGRLVKLAFGLVRWAGGTAMHALTHADRALRWALRTALTLLRASGYILVGLMALFAFGLAGVAALAPDIIGFMVFDFNREVGIFLEEVRRHTVYHYTPDSQSMFIDSGMTVMVVALTTGLLLIMLLGLVVYHRRRRRTTEIG